MQNMSGSQLRESFAFSRRNAVLFCAALLALACALVALAPGQAHAKSYTMPKVDIQAQVETDGALQVTEQRTFDFDGLPQNASLKINGVRMANVDADGTVVGDWTTLPSEAFVLGWRESGGPGKDSYSFDAPKNSVYVFFNASDDRRIIELDYTVVNGAQAYSDIGEVYWKYVGSQWKEASDNVTMTLALPACCCSPGRCAPTSSTDANTSPGLPTSIGATCLTPPSIRRLSDACGAGIARAKTISRLRSCILRMSAPSASTRAVTRSQARSGA